MGWRMLEGERLSLRPLADGDILRLREILTESAVARWWPPDALDGWESSVDVTRMSICVEDRVSGLIQYHETDDPRYRHAGIDLFLTTELHGRGLGAEAIRLVARHLLTERGHHRLVIDPALANAAAVRCYERVGFHPVGVMRRYERDHRTGEWADGLLMEMLAGELS